MRAVRVIPCLDVDAGRVVKGVRFVDLVDAGDPVELAARYDAEGADELVFLDITASADERDTMVDVVSRTAERGVHPLHRGRRGADARRRPSPVAGRCRQGGAEHRRRRRPRRSSRELADEFGSQCVVVAIDARRRTAATGMGGLHPRWAPARRARTPWRGRQQCADARGGGDPRHLDGPRRHAPRASTWSSPRAIVDTVGVPVVASGGVGTLEHLVEGATEGGADAVLAASIFHRREYTVAEAKAYLAAHGVVVRPPAVG